MIIPCKEVIHIGLVSQRLPKAYASYVQFLAPYRKRKRYIVNLQRCLATEHCIAFSAEYHYCRLAARRPSV
jgi:hypothetical protein